MQHPKYEPATPRFVKLLTLSGRAALMWFPADGSPRRWIHGAEDHPANRTLAALRQLGWVEQRSVRNSRTGKTVTERWLTPAGVKARRRLAELLAERCGTLDKEGMEPT